MGRQPPPSDPPDRPDGRYTYVEESEPPQGLRRRERQQTKRGIGPILQSLHPSLRPPRTDPPEEKVKKALGKVIGKAIEWAVVTACAASLAWLTTRASKDDVKDVRAECAAEASARVAAVKALTDRLEAEEKARLDAGQWVGESLNRQDGINRHVWERLGKQRETAPPPVGPKAQAEGRQ